MTRPVGKGLETARLIRTLGWSPLIVNTVQLQARPESELYPDLRSILAEGPIDHLVFMSQLGVDVVFSLLRTHGSVLPSMMGNPSIVAVGPRTKAAVERWGVRDVLVPDEYSSNGIASLLSSTHFADEHVVLVRSSDADDELADLLTSKGSRVSTLHGYSSALPSDFSTVSELISNLRMNNVAGLLFTSAQSASNLFEIAAKTAPEPPATLLRACLVGAIGPMTRTRLQALGVKADVQPSKYLIEEAVKMMIDLLEKSASTVRHLAPRSS